MSLPVQTISTNLTKFEERCNDIAYKLRRAIIGECLTLDPGYNTPFNNIEVTTTGAKCAVQNYTEPLYTRFKLRRKVNRVPPFRDEITLQFDAYSRRHLRYTERNGKGLDFDKIARVIVEGWIISLRLREQNSRLLTMEKKNKEAAETTVACLIHVGYTEEVARKAVQPSNEFNNCVNLDLRYLLDFDGTEGLNIFEAQNVALLCAKLNKILTEGVK
jgi:hypothetical protein